MSWLTLGSLFGGSQRGWGKKTKLEEDLLVLLGGRRQETEKERGQCHFQPGETGQPKLDATNTTHIPDRSSEWSQSHTCC